MTKRGKIKSQAKEDGEETLTDLCAQVEWQNKGNM